MKNILLILTLLSLTYSCSEDNDDNLIASTEASISLKFTHNWDGNAVSKSDFGTLKYLNANNEKMSIELLRYLVSDIKFFDESGALTYTTDAYNLVNVTTGENMEFLLPDNIPIGHYSNVSFTFGFPDSANIDGQYTDLNSVSWNVPLSLGGGYHYMQLEGKFINTTTDGTEETEEELAYQFHVIRAADTTTGTPITQDTSINVNLGPVTIRGNKTITVKMNIAEWFKNPHTWNLSTKHENLMSDYNAQIQMNANGQNVFSIAE